MQLNRLHYFFVPDHVARKDKVVTLDLLRDLRVSARRGHREGKGER